MAGQQGKRVNSSAPPGLKVSGRRLWDSVCDEYELEEFESSVLLQAAQTLDIIDGLQDAIDTLGVDCAIRELVEVRQQRLAYARLLAALRLPQGDEKDPAVGRRPQRRHGARGVYQLGAR
jgi:hypothetical protein